MKRCLLVAVLAIAAMCWVAPSESQACGRFCSIGGAIDSVLDLKVRTKQLKDLFDPEFAHQQTCALCDVCGRELGITSHHIANWADRRYAAWWDSQGLPFGQGPNMLFINSGTPAY